MTNYKWADALDVAGKFVGHVKAVYGLELTIFAEKGQDLSRRVRIEGAPVDLIASHTGYVCIPDDRNIWHEGQGETAGPWLSGLITEDRFTDEDAPEETQMTSSGAAALRTENEKLRHQVAELEAAQKPRPMSEALPSYRETLGEDERILVLCDNVGDAKLTGWYTAYRSCADGYYWVELEEVPEDQFCGWIPLPGSDPTL